MPVDAAELYVFFGIMIIIGCVGYSRVAQYWSSACDGNFRVPIVADSILRDRFQFILAKITFNWRGTTAACFVGCVVCSCKTNYEEFITDSDPLSKLRHVDTYIRSRCAAAICFCQKFVVDESMIQCASRYCKWLQFMPSKPIKYGMKVWCIVFSGKAENIHAAGYLWDWRPYLGKKDPIKAQAARDGKPYVYTLIYEHLIPAAWDHLIICDNYFTSIALFIALLVRGVYAVSVSKAKKPRMAPIEGRSMPSKTTGKAMSLI